MPENILINRFDDLLCREMADGGKILLKVRLFIFD
jgi:hypothetical protein